MLYVTYAFKMNVKIPCMLKCIKPFRLQIVPKKRTYILYIIPLKNITLLFFGQLGKNERILSTYAYRRSKTSLLYLNSCKIKQSKLTQLKTIPIHN